MRLLVRSWNLFHGNTDPPGRRGRLRQMIELATADAPDLLCLQEVPVWALAVIGDWSGMGVFSAIARPPLWPGPVGRWVTLKHQGLFRSALAGQANAILVGRGHRAVSLGHERISDPGRERRVVHAVRLGEAPELVVANLHASNEFGDPGVPRAEVERAREFVEALRRPTEPIVLAGDFNIAAPHLEGYSAPGPGIDHVLVNRPVSAEVRVWPVERRVQNGRVLSDHAPVELVVELP